MFRFVLWTVGGIIEALLLLVAIGAAIIGDDLLLLTATAGAVFGGALLFLGAPPSERGE